MSYLELRGVTVRLGGQPILQDFSLGVEAGELLVLAGPSGSGKSTLLRAIAGLLPLAAGEILIDGRRVDSLGPGERDVAMMFQSYALFPHLSVRDNLGFGLRARGVARAETASRVEAVAATLDLARHLDKLPRELSGGERQRVALGRAMLRQPKVFLMDEPLSNLDAQLRVRARAEVLRLHRQLGSVTVYVTHDQDEALAIADRLGVLDQGRLHQLAQPLQVYHAPANLFVARFLGSPPMNFLPVQAGPPGLVRWRAHAIPLAVARSLEAGRELLLGVRPEHLHIEGSRWAPALGDAPSFDARIDTVEPVGDQQYVLLDAEGQTLTARAEPDLPLQRGATVRLRLDPARLHLFDPASGDALIR